jgi:hypothetical protein
MPGKKKDKGFDANTVFDMNKFLALDPDRKRKAIEFAVMTGKKLNRQNAGWAGFKKGGKVSSYYKDGGIVVTGRD